MDKIQRNHAIYFTIETSGSAYMIIIAYIKIFDKWIMSISKSGI